jgi:hypothetical protein
MGDRGTTRHPRKGPVKSRLVRYFAVEPTSYGAYTFPLSLFKTNLYWIANRYGQETSGRTIGLLNQRLDEATRVRHRRYLADIEKAKRASRRWSRYIQAITRVIRR